MLFNQLNFTDLNLSLDGMKMDFNCYQCSTDGLNTLSSIVTKYQQAINDYVVKFTSEAMSPNLKND